MEEAKQYAGDEREKLVSKWRLSGMSKAAFCREHRIDLSWFYSWSCPSSNKRKKDKAVGFNPVRTPPSAATSLIIIQFPNGIQVKLPFSSDIDQVLRMSSLRVSYNVSKNKPIVSFRPVTFSSFLILLKETLSIVATLLFLTLV